MASRKDIGGAKVGVARAFIGAAGSSSTSSAQLDVFIVGCGVTISQFTSIATAEAGAEAGATASVASGERGARCS